MAFRSSKVMGAAIARSRNWLSLDDTPITIGFVGLLAYTIITVTYKFRVAEIAVALALFGAITGRQIRVGPPVAIFAVFSLWAGIGSIQAISPSTSLDAVYELVKLLLIMWAAVNVLRTSGQVHWFLLVYTSCFFAFGVLMSLWFYVNGIRVVGRATGFAIYGNPNDLAALALLAFATMVGVGIAANRNFLVRFGSFSAAATTAALLVLTQSRGALLAFLLVFSPLLIEASWRNRRARIGLLVLGIAGVAALPNSAWQRLAGLRNFSTTEDNRAVDPEGSAAERWKILQIATAVVRDNPLLGVGLGNYGLANAAYAPEMGRKDTHNTYMNVTAETGVVGILLYLLIVGSVIVTSIRSARSRTAEGDHAHAALLNWMTAGLIAYSIASIFGSYNRIAFTYLYMAVLWTTAQLPRPIGKPAPTAARPSGRKRDSRPRSNSNRSPRTQWAPLSGLESAPNRDRTGY
jgi:O-antigen ligase